MKLSMKMRAFVIATGAALLMAGCASASSRNVVLGSDTMTSHTIPIEDFTAVVIDGEFDVSFRNSSEATLGVEIQEDMFEHLSVHVQNGALIIGSNKPISTSVNNTPRVNIGAPYLEAVVLRGAVNATNWDEIRAQDFFIGIDGASKINITMHVEHLDVDVSGAASLELHGSADIAHIYTSGASEVSAGNLQTLVAGVEISGAGGVHIAVSERLYVDISGAGNVLYSGNPVIEQNISGVGSVRQY